MGCPCSGGTPMPVFTDCQETTVSDLQGFLDHFRCVQTNGLYIQVSMSADYVNERIGLLSSMIADKQANGASCAYQGYVEGITVDVTNIVLNSIC